MNRPLVVGTALLIGAIGCATRGRVSAPGSASPDASAAGGLNTLVREGCYLCLRDALTTYAALPASAQSRADVTQAAERAALLFLIRQKELGIPDAGAVAEARAVAAANATAVGEAPLVLRAIDALPANAQGLGEEATALHTTSRGFDDLRRSADLLADRWRSSDVSAYAYLSLACTIQNRVPADVAAVVDLHAASGAVRYRAATCGASDGPALRALVAADPRFNEVDYFLGLSAANTDRDGSPNFERAWQGIPNFTAARLALAQAALAGEELERCVAAAGDVLRIVPGHSSAMVLMLEALSRLGRRDEAVALGNTLAKGSWYLGDANYWLAWNELQSGQLDAALGHAIAAQQYGASARLWGLTGLVHAARHELIPARDAFRSGIELDSHDCDLRYRLADTLVSLSQLADARAAFLTAASCYADRSSRLAEDLDALSGDFTWTGADEHRFATLLGRDRQAATMTRKALGRADESR